MKNNFLFVANFSNIFYNVVSILIGIMLIVFGVFKIIKNKKIAFAVICFIHGALFMGFGIAGFFFPDKYSFIPILAMLAFSITMIICYILMNPKVDKNNKK